MGDINVKWPIVNPLWDYKRFSLRKYLVDLNVVEPYDTTLTMYEGVYEFYIRMAYGRNYETKDKQSISYMMKDPWNRLFKCFPKTFNSLGYDHTDDKYACTGHYILDDGMSNNNTTIRSYYDCYVITTTVEGEIVYCLDLMTK